MYPKVLAVAASLISLGASVRLDAHHGLDLRSAREEPCKQVRDQAAKWMADNGIVPKNRSELRSFMPATPSVPIRPSIALACLKSVPLYKDSALQQLDFLRPLLEWQSSVEYLRDPPQGYLSEGVDLIRGLDDIAAKLKEEKRGGYANELEFLADLRMLTSVRPRDFHFGYWTLLLDLFDFPMSAQFISISDDGLAMPKIYLYDDVKHAQNGYTPSPVLTIDGVPALEFLQKASVNIALSHDPDARFNGMFRSLATDTNLAYVSPEPFALFLGDTTKVTCHNGTRFEFSNAARLRANFTKITSGADLYDVYGRGDSTDERPLNARFYQLAERNYTAAFVGYPKPFKSTRHVAGFLPESSEFSDIAVLALNSFNEAPNLDHVDRSMSVQQRDFYQVVVDSISAAKAANRTKLVLDFQGNGGGLTSNIMALYFALFPGDTLPVLWQARAHPQFAWLGKQAWDPTSSIGQWPVYNMMRPDGKPWSSFEELYGPFPDAPAGQKRWGQHTHPAIENTTWTKGSIADNCGGLSWGPSLLSALQYPGRNSTTPGAKRCLFGRSAHVEGLFGGAQWVREAELYMGAANGKKEP
ncbi:hypothetical protein N657DRAFT_675792 [Parathielavia appendiculata]|uniref:CPAF-like PDZ domain-containing protein n=1 Tax=Parathielavia appendiculata TaxID=2587402 RepID=A0AAN6TP61_9PEZI|nr:hypothetical protein N657DRAFT_675792 [Parathielavia appendiculata]